MDFPEYSQPNDIKGEGTVEEFMAAFGHGRTPYAEVRLLVDEAEIGGLRAGTFGELQAPTEDGIDISVLFTGDGQGGGQQISGLVRTTLSLNDKIEWVIHVE